MIFDSLEGLVEKARKSKKKQVYISYYIIETKLPC